MALLWAVIASVDEGDLKIRLFAMDGRWLAAAAALGPIQVVLAGLRWKRVCDALGVEIDYQRAVAEVGLSTALNQVLPAGVAGDALRVWRQRGHGAKVVIETVVVDRAMGLAMLLAFASGAWFLPGAGWVVLGVSLVGLMLALSPLGAGFRHVMVADGLWHATLSGLLTGTFVLGFVLAGCAVHVDPGMWAFTAVPLLLLAMSVPLTLGGWGPREMSAVVVWPLMGGSPEEGVAVAAAYGLSVLLGALPGVGFWAWRAS